MYLAIDLARFSGLSWRWWYSRSDRSTSSSGLGNHFGAAAKACQEMADIAVVLFDGTGQVFAGEELVFRDQAVVARPVVADEGLAFNAGFIEELLTCGVITATKNPGNGSPSERVIGAPNP